MAHPHFLRCVLAAALVAAAPSASAANHAGQASGTWLAADSPHVVQASLLVPTGNVLTLEAGSLVQFTSGTSLDVQGSIVFRGTASAPIRLTGDGAISIPGSWGGVVLAGASTAELDHVVLDGAEVAVTVNEGARLDVSNSTIQASLDDGIHFRQGSTGLVTDCLFMGNGGTGLRIVDSSPRAGRCDFLGNRVPVQLTGASRPLLQDLRAASNLATNGVILDGSKPFDGAGMLRNAGIPYVVADGQAITVPYGEMLLFGGGAVLKLGNQARIVAEGNFGMTGSPTRPCIVTSLLDDTAGGDTNGDGSSSAPGKGDWSGLETGGEGSVYLGWTDVRYGNDAVRVFPLGQATVLASEIHHCLNRGIAIGVETAALIDGTSFHDLDIGVQVQDPAGVRMGRPNSPTEPGPGGMNSFACNASFHVENLGSVPLDAQRNYWGTDVPQPGWFSGPIDLSNALGLMPEAELPFGRKLLLTHAGVNDLRFEWRETSSCASFSVMTSPRAEGPFSTLATNLNAEVWIRADGAVPTGTRTTFFRIDLE